MLHEGLATAIDIALLSFMLEALLHKSVPNSNGTFSVTLPPLCLKILGTRLCVIILTPCPQHRRVLLKTWASIRALKQWAEAHSNALSLPIPPRSAGKSGSPPCAGQFWAWAPLSQGTGLAQLLQEAGTQESLFLSLSNFLASFPPLFWIQALFHTRI